MFQNYYCQSFCLFLVLLWLTWKLQVTGRCLLCCALREHEGLALLPKRLKKVTDGQGPRMCSCKLLSSWLDFVVISRIFTGLNGDWWDLIMAYCFPSEMTRSFLVDSYFKTPLNGMVPRLFTRGPTLCSIKKWFSTLYQKLASCCATMRSRRCYQFTQFESVNLASFMSVWGCYN